MVSKKGASRACYVCSIIQCSESVGLLRLQHESLHAIVATYRTESRNDVATAAQPATKPVE